MSTKSSEDGPDDQASEFTATVGEQTEQEIAQDEMDAAADRRTLDRIIRLVEVTTRSRDMGTSDCGLGNLATNAIDALVSAACQRGARIMRSDMTP